MPNNRKGNAAGLSFAADGEAASVASSTPARVPCTQPS